MSENSTGFQPVAFDL